MKHLLLLPIVFILLQEYQGGRVLVSPEKIRMVFEEPEGARIIFDACDDLLVTNEVEDILNMIWLTYEVQEGKK